MLGLGEELDEVAPGAARAARDSASTSSRSASTCARRAAHLPVARYVHPDEFAALKADALALGFPHVESGPLVRSSYHADGQRDIVASRLRDATTTDRS